MCANFTSRILFRDFHLDFSWFFSSTLNKFIVKAKRTEQKSQFNYQHTLMLIKNRAWSVTLNISANCNEQTKEMLIQLVRLSWYATINLNSRLRLFGVWLRSTLSGEIFKVVYCVTHLTWITTWKWSGFSRWFTFNCRSILSKLIGT